LGAQVFTRAIPLPVALVAIQLLQRIDRMRKFPSAHVTTMLWGSADSCSQSDGKRTVDCGVCAEAPEDQARIASTTTIREGIDRAMETAQRQVWARRRVSAQTPSGTTRVWMPRFGRQGAPEASGAIGEPPGATGLIPSLIGAMLAMLAVAPQPRGEPT